MYKHDDEVQKIVLYGDIIGYQFAKNKMGKRTIYRKVAPIGFVNDVQYGVFKWKGLRWLCGIDVWSDHWLGIDTMQSRERITKNSRVVYEIKKELHHETGALLATWFYDGVKIVKVVNEKEYLI